MESKTQNEKEKESKPVWTSESPNQTLLSRLWFLFVEWCKSSTSHGIPNIARSESLIIRLIWALSVGVSVSYCGYLIIDTFINFMSNPVSINIQILEETPTMFPTISICNLNPFKQGDPYIDTVFNNLIKSQNLSVYDSHAPKYLESSSRILKSYVSGLNDSQKMYFGNDLKDMISYCTFNSYKCSASDFDWFYDFNYGNCYKFNPNGLKYVGKGGLNGGLQLELYIGNSSSEDSYSNNRGVRFMVHNHSLSVPIMYDYGSDAAPGFMTNIKIRRNIYKKLDQPFNDCMMDLTRNSAYKTLITDIIFNMLNQTQYSKDLCIKMCYQRNLLEGCRCASPSIPSYPNWPKCISPSQINCSDAVFTRFYSAENTECQRLCPKGKSIKMID